MDGNGDHGRDVVAGCYRDVGDVAFAIGLRPNQETRSTPENVPMTESNG